VTVKGPEDVEGQSVRIETNSPLFRNGFRLYQSDIDKREPYRYSVFSVSKDPGVPWVTIGFLVMTIGLLWLYLDRFMLKPIDRARRQTGGGK